MTKDYTQHHEAAAAKQPFNVYKMAKGDLTKFFALQAETKSRKNGLNLKERTLKEIEEQLDGGNVILGVMDNAGNHVAQCIIANPNNDVSTNMDAFDGLDNYLAIQSVAFAEGFRPRQLADWDTQDKPDTKLFQAAKNMAEDAGVQNLHAKIRDGNGGSFAMFERANFTTGALKYAGDNDYLSAVVSFDMATVAASDSKVPVAKYLAPLADPPPQGVNLVHP